MKHVLSLRARRGGLLALAPAAAALLFVVARLGGAQDHADHDESPLHEEMEGLKDNLKGLATALRDPSQHEDSLRFVAEMQRHVLAAKLLEPANIEDVPAEGRAAHEVAFRRDLAGLLGLLAELEIDLLDERIEDAKAKVAGPLLELRESAHDKYQKEE